MPNPHLDDNPHTVPAYGEGMGLDETIDAVAVARQKARFELGWSENSDDELDARVEALASQYLKQAGWFGCPSP